MPIRLLLLTSGVLLMAAVIGISLWSIPAVGSANPPTAGLTYRGNLAHAWQGAIEGRCDFAFQPYDSEINGMPVGQPVLAEGVVVRAGEFSFPVPAGALDQTGATPDWLAVEVRCDGDGVEFSALGPRLRHHSSSEAGWEAPQGSLLICSLPVAGETSAASTAAPHSASPPTLDSATYRLQGGFYTGG